MPSDRWPGSAISNTTFNNDDLLDRELTTIARFITNTTVITTITMINITTIARFIALSSKEESGVKIVPALKVSRKTENT